MTPRLEGKRTLVTGAGQGIGHQTCLAFADEGAVAVWAIDRNPGTLAMLHRQRPQITTRAVDVTDAAAVAALAAEVGTVDVVLACAGVVPHGTILDCTPEQWAEAMTVNVTGTYNTIRAFLPAMLATGGGSIITMASVVSSIAGVPDRAAYGASKAAVIGLTKAVAADFAGAGIRCNAIAPGTIDTPSLADRIAAFPDPVGARTAFVARQPLGRLGTPAEIAALAVYLGSDESAYTTGSVLVADGGMSL